MKKICFKHDFKRGKYFSKTIYIRKQYEHDSHGEKLKRKKSSFYLQVKEKYV